MLSATADTSPSRLPPPGPRYRLVDIICVASLLLFATIVFVHEARHKFFWFDELCTVVVVRQRTLAGIWSALSHAVDSHPPLFYLFVSLFRPIVGHDEVGFRLASLVGFLCIPTALFIFVRRRAGTVSALIAALIPFLSVLFTTYAVEARGYALVTGCLALGLIFWQHTKLPRHSVILGALFTTAASLHYYAVFAVTPFAVAELARYLRTREVRIGIWLAILCSVLPLIVFWPVLSNYKRMYGGRFFQMADLKKIPRGYAEMFNLHDRWLIAAVLLAVIVIVVTLILTAHRPKRDRPQCWCLLEEHWLAIGFIALPAVGYVFARLTGGAMKYDRYAIATVLGISLGTAFLSSQLGQKTERIFLVLLVGALVVQQRQIWTAHSPVATTSTQFPATLWLEEMIDRHGSPDLPVVVANGTSYLSMVYYGAHHKTHLISVVDPRSALDFTQSDTMDLELLVLKSYLPLDVRAYSTFVRQYPTFLLYCDGYLRWSWVLQRLANDHASIRSLASDGDRTLYLVAFDPEPLRRALREEPEVAFPRYLPERAEDPLERFPKLRTLFVDPAIVMRLPPSISNR